MSAVDKTEIIMCIYSLAIGAVNVYIAYRLAAKYNQARFRPLLNWLCLLIALQLLLVTLCCIIFYKYDFADMLIVVVLAHFYTMAFAIYTVFPIAILSNTMWFYKHYKGVARK